MNCCMDGHGTDHGCCCDGLDCCNGHGKDEEMSDRPRAWYLSHASDNLNKLAGLTGPDEWGEYPFGEELGELIEDTRRLIAGAIAKDGN